MKSFYLLPRTLTVKRIIMFCLTAFTTLQALGQDPGQALQLNGGQWATMTVGFNNVYNDYTVEAWVRPMDATKVMTIFSTRGAAGSDNSQIAFDLKMQDGNKIRADIPNLKGSSYTWASSSPVDVTYKYVTGHWYHIACVVSGTNHSIQVYVNGIAQFQPTAFQQNFDKAWLFDAAHATGYIGSNRGYNTTEDFVGDIDELKIYNASNIDPAADAISKSTTNNGNLAIAYYHFDNSTATSVPAATNAVLQGSPSYLPSYAMQLITITAASNVYTTGFTANWAADTSSLVTNFFIDIATDADFTNILPFNNFIKPGVYYTTFSGLTAGATYYYRVIPNNTAAAITGQGAYSTGTVQLPSVTPAPVIKSFLPVKAVPGQGVAIKGNNFTGTAAVSFGGIAARAFNVVSDTIIYAIADSNSSGSISVSSSKGTDSKPGFTIISPAPASINYPANNTFKTGVAGSATVTVTAPGTITSISSHIAYCLAADPAGNLFTGNLDDTLFKFSPDGTVSTIGSGFSLISGVTTDASGNIYVADHNAIKKITPGGTTTTLLPEGFSNIGVAIAADQLGNVFFGDQIYNSIMRLDGVTGQLTTVWTSPSNQISPTVPIALTLDPVGNIFFIGRDFTSNGGNVQEVATNGFISSSIGSFGAPYSIAIDLAGNLYIGDGFGNPSISKMTTTGKSSFLTLTGQKSAVATDVSGNVYYLQTGLYPTKYSGTGGTATYTISPALPAGLTIDATSGMISGTPTVVSPKTKYTVTASNSGGSTTDTLNVTVNGAPASLSYGAASFSFRQNSVISTLKPGYDNTQGTPTSYTISPALPAGLSFDGSTGYISGTPATLTAPVNYTITAKNSSGQTTVTLNIQVTYPLATTLYVDGDKGSDNNFGTAWNKAFKTLAKALQAASTNAADTILVAKGTYYPIGTGAANSDSSFAITHNGIRLYGGYDATTGTRDININKTYLDGNNNSLHILVIAGIGAGDSVIIDGVTIQHALVNSGVAGHTYNGVSFNSDEGAGVAIRSNSGLGNMLLFRNCVFINNTTSNNGAAVYTSQSSPVFVNCLFANNSSRSGTLFSYDHCSPRIINCTFANNTVTTDGGALTVIGTSTAEIDNSIIWLNGTSAGANNSGITTDGSSGTTGSNSIIQATAGAVDPLFVNASTGNYQLSTLSPAINTGSNSLYAGRINNDADLAGNARLKDAIIDMGAYEAAPPATVYVDAANGNDANQGTSWAAALKTLSGAIKLTTVNHITNSILLAAGTYYPAGTGAATTSNSDTAFIIHRNGVRVYGGYDATTGVRNAATNKTYLDGNGSSYHIMVISGIGAGDSVIVDGITFRNAQALNNGGLHTYNGTGFNSNEGGAVAAKNNSALGNKLLFRNCSFFNNNSENDGGAFYNAETSPYFVNCLFANNTSTVNGGAMFNYDGSNPVFVNCTIAYNTSARGAAIDNFGSSAPVLNNSIVWLNGTAAGSNNSGVTNNATPVATGSNSIIQGGIGSNSTADPLFVSASTGNFQLSSTASPAFNTGSNSLYAGNINNDVDVNSNARLSYTTIDMGAYEYNGLNNLTYNGAPYTFAKTDPAQTPQPTVTGGTVAKYTISPTLPAGLAIDASTGIISGTPTAAGAATNYTVTASNSNSSTTATIGITVTDLSPTITSFTPTESAPGNEITINGTNLTTKLRGILIGGVGVSEARSLEPTQIITKIPAGVAAGSVSVSVLTQYGTATLAGLTIDPVPTITSFTPAQGGTNTSVSIVGTGFTPGATVSFNGTPAASVTYYDATDITASPAPGTSTGLITVTTLGGTATSSTNFTYYNLPTITSFNPTSGKPGDVITITGTDLDNITSVYIDSHGAQVNTNTSTTVTITMPDLGVADDGIAAPFVVTTPGGTVQSSTFFTWNELVPTMASFSPLQGGTGTVITVKGTNLQYVTGVNVGGYKAGNITVNDDGTQLTATVGNGGNGPVQLFYIAENAIPVTSSNQFTFYTAPTVAYNGSPFTFIQNTDIISLMPSIGGGGGPDPNFGISPALPAGLQINAATGVISGTPTAISPLTTYTITATNTGGSSTTTINLQVTYPTNTTVYVDGANGSDNNDGSSNWGNAFKTLSYALQAASTNLNINRVLIAKGAYYPTGAMAVTDAGKDSALAITRNGLRLYGGYDATTGLRNAAVNKTYLDGNGKSYHILAIAGIGAGDSVIIDGIAIQNAACNGGTTHTYNGQGFNGNEGGGVSAVGNSGLGGKLLFRNCMFTNNTGNNHAAALYNNESSPSFVNCLFANNTDAYDGGTIFNWSNSKPVFTNCTIAYNVTGNNGAAISSAGGSVPVFNNSILWLNGNTSGANNSGITGSFTTANSIIFGTAGTVDPLFVYAAGGDYSLSASSPAINTGSNALYYGDLNNDADIAGKARLAGTNIDRGAYENQGTVTWTGATSTDWNTGTNWSTNTVPAQVDYADIPPGPVNQPIVSADAAVHSLTIGGRLTVTGATLSIGGDVTSSGTFDASAGNITYNGTAAQTIAGTVTVKNLTVNNNAGVLLYSGSTKVYGTYTPQAGTLNANGKLVLASTAEGTANVAAGNGNYITGGVTVERYLPNVLLTAPTKPRRAWRLLTAPLSQTGTIYNNWQNGGVADGSTGAVIFKPGVGGGDGYTAGGNEASLEYYDEVADNWVDVPNTNATSLGNNNTSAANHAYSMFITGPYGSNTISSGSAPTTLRATGLLQTGNQTFTYTPGNNHYMLTGNPYASPVDLANVINNATGIVPQTFWTWDPNRAGTSVGGYVTFTWDGSKYINDMTGQTLQTTVLQSGEAFFTQADNSGGTVTIPFTEGDKASAAAGTNGVFFAPTGSPGQSLRVALNKNINNTMTAIDGVLALYNDGYNKDATDDAAKLYNYDENMSIRISNNYIAIQKAPLPQKGDSLWLDVYGMKAKSNYSFTFTPQNIPTNVQAWIVDRYLNTQTPVDLTTTTDVAFTTTADKASYGETRFVVVFATKGTLASTLTNVKAWQQDKTNQVEWTTATEQGVQQYIVEKSTNGQSFKQIGVPAIPRNTGRTEVYDLTDHNPVIGDNYYRVQVINKDAAPACSNVVMVKVLKGKPAFTVSPNPVQKSQQVHVTYTNMDAGKYALILYGSDGKKVLQHSVSLDGTSATETISLPLSLAAATYRLVLVDEKGHTWAQALVVD